jgi:hypothetical protein
VKEAEDFKGQGKQKAQVDDRTTGRQAEITITGSDLFVCQKTLEVPVSGIGPLLVLKLNAFDDRQQPKDAYDVMLGVISVSLRTIISEPL